MEVRVFFDSVTYLRDDKWRGMKFSMSSNLSERETADIFKRAQVCRYNVSCCSIGNEHTVMEKLQATHDHVVSEAIQRCSTVAERPRERMVDKFVKYITVLLD